MIVYIDRQSVSVGGEETGRKKGGLANGDEKIASFSFARVFIVLSTGGLAIGRAGEGGAETKGQQARKQAVRSMGGCRRVVHLSCCCSAGRKKL